MWGGACRICSKRLHEPRSCCSKTRHAFGIGWLGKFQHPVASQSAASGLVWFGFDTLTTTFPSSVAFVAPPHTVPSTAHFQRRARVPPCLPVCTPSWRAPLHVSPRLAIFPPTGPRSEHELQMELPPRIALPALRTGSSMPSEKHMDPKPLKASTYARNRFQESSDRNLKIMTRRFRGKAIWLLGHWLEQNVKTSMQGATPQFCC